MVQNVVNLPTYEQVEEVKTNILEIGTAVANVESVSGLISGKDGKKFIAVEEEYFEFELALSNGYEDIEVFEGLSGIYSDGVSLFLFIDGNKSNNSVYKRYASIEIFDAKTLKFVKRLVIENLQLSFLFNISNSSSFMNTLVDDGERLHFPTSIGTTYYMACFNKNTLEFIQSTSNVSTGNSIPTFISSDGTYLIYAVSNNVVYKTPLDWYLTPTIPKQTVAYIPPTPSYSAHGFFTVGNSSYSFESPISGAGVGVAVRKINKNTFVNEISTAFNSTLNQGVPRFMGVQNDKAIVQHGTKVYSFNLDTLVMESQSSKYADIAAVSNFSSIAPLRDFLFNSDTMYIPEGSTSAVGIVERDFMKGALQNKKVVKIKSEIATGRNPSDFIVLDKDTLLLCPTSRTLKVFKLKKEIRIEGVIV